VLTSIKIGLDSGRRVYVHCKAGIGRTGLIVGCHLAEAESSGRKALKTLNRLWKQSERSEVFPSVPQTAEQADYIRHWPKFGRRTS
jgi:protein tyrosine phosphatase